jgi:putative ABC transport system permease protein
MQEFADFMRFQTRPSDTGAPAQTLELDNTRALVSEQLANQFGLASGSTITLRDFDDKEASFEVGGAMENYVYHYIYLSPSAFTEGFKQAFEPNQLVGIFAPGHTRLPTAIEQHGIVTSVTYSQDNADTFANTLNALQYVVLVLIVSAAALVFVVLFSLTTINLEERSRELASLEVLGFYDRELAAYIYRESFILTTAGIALGLGLGVLLERYIITTMEIDVFMFSRDLLWPSFVLSALLTAVFALAVNLFMYRSITSINMVSSLKNVE